MRLIQAAALSLTALMFFIVVEGLFVFHRAIDIQFASESVAVRRFFPLHDDQTGVALYTVQPPEECRVYSLLGIHDLASGGGVRRSFERLPSLTAVCASREGNVFVNTRGGEVYALEGLPAAPELRLLGRDARMFPHAFETSDDGRLLLMAGRDLTVWDRDGRELWRRRGMQVTCGQFIPGSWQMICALYDGPVVELDAVTGETRRQIVPGTRRIGRLAISADSNLLATRDTTGICAVYDLKAGDDLSADCQRAEMRVEEFVGDVQFTADGSKLIVSNPYLGVPWAAYSTESLRLVRAVAGPSGPLTGLRLGSNGRVYVWNRSATVGIWDVDTGELIETLTYRTPEERWLWRIYREWLTTTPLTAAVMGR